MKKLISSAVVAVAFLGIATPSTFAFGCRCFGLCPHHGCCCKCCCSCCICCRQYNAFTPCCCGSICCNGCCPIGCCGGGCGGGACGDMGGPCVGGSCGPMGCGGPLASAPVGPVTSQAVTDPCAPATSVAAAPKPQSPIQTTTYRPYTPAYTPPAAPAATPGYYRPQPAAVPSYWYGN